MYSKQQERLQTLNFTQNATELLTGMFSFPLICGLVDGCLSMWQHCSPGCRHSH